MVEMTISIVAIVIILALARMGVHFGAFYEITSTMLLFLAMLFALRYWYPLTRWITGWFGGGAGYAAFGAYWTLFLVGCSPLLLVMSRVTADSMPRYPKLLDVVLGFLFGSGSATILVCCVLTSLSVLGPKLYEPYNPDAMVTRLDKWPIVAYQVIEQGILHVPPTDPGHTRFPTFEKSDVDDFQKYWQ